MAPRLLAVTLCAAALLFVEYADASAATASNIPLRLSVTKPAALRPLGNPASRKLLGWAASIGNGNSGNGANTATLLAEDTTEQAIDDAADGEVTPYVAAETGVLTGQLASLASQQSGNYRGNGQQWVGNRKLAAATATEGSRTLLGFGSGSGNNANAATLWAEDTTEQSINNAASGGGSANAAARTGLLTGELATLASQRSDDQYWVGGRRLAAATPTESSRTLLEFGSGSGNNANAATLWAEDTTEQSINNAASGGGSANAAARTGLLTGELATLASQRSDDQNWVGGRRLAAAGSSSSGEAAWRSNVGVALQANTAAVQDAVSAMAVQEDTNTDG